MQKSSNSLLHFTNNIDILTNILKSKFYGSYCKEHFVFKELEYTLYVPKISFCDIPEETIFKYTHYGKYCIGLSKDWGKMKRLNPVLYIEKNSIIAESFIKSFHAVDEGIHLVNNSILDLKTYFEFIKSNSNLSEDEKQFGYKRVSSVLDQVEALSKVVTFGQYMPYHVKHYEDKLITKAQEYDHYRFYDEREWCYVPDELQKSNELYKNKIQYELWRNENRDKKLLDNVSLEFNFSDITHLFVENEEDKIKLIQEIDTISDDKISLDERHRLINLIAIFGQNMIS